MFKCFLYVTLLNGSILSALPSFMKTEMAIQLSVKTSTNFNQNLFSSSEAETSRRTDAKIQTPTYVYSAKNAQ